jgi:hypothetical protein
MGPLNQPSPGRCPTGTGPPKTAWRLGRSSLLLAGALLLVAALTAAAVTAAAVIGAALIWASLTGALAAADWPLA